MFSAPTLPLLAQFQERIPVLYADLEPNAAQATQLATARSGCAPRVAPAREAPTARAGPEHRHAT
jgi:hypothetical protein